ITSPTAPPIITSPISAFAAYDLVSFIRPRMYGSSESQWTRTRSSPSLGSGIGASSIVKLATVGQPLGRPARRTRVLVVGIAPSDASTARLVAARPLYVAIFGNHLSR